jgi:tetratricopeptide (TPR) repeat protein
MRITSTTWSYVTAIAVVGAAAVAIGRANRDRASDAAHTTTSAMWQQRSTSREGLERTIQEMERRLRERPADAEAAETLADALLRRARVSGNAGLAMRAEAVLQRVLRDAPESYGTRRMLGAVLLSQHRFRDAIVQADLARRQRPDDDWNYGVIGDAHIELGEYDEAFDAFQRMIDLRPTAGAYARASYALELRGRLDAAVRAMRMSTDATSPGDAESIAWHHAQLGDLYRQMGRTKEASLEYEWAEHAFPDHPFAERGLAALLEQQGDLRGALARLEVLMTRTPSPDVAAKIGDLRVALGDTAEGERSYALAVAAWRSDAPHPAQFARFLAEHDRELPEAVLLAERAAADRHDIFTEDALAWVYFKSGRVRDAAAAMTRALRTGTRDRSILFHAAAIATAMGDATRGHRLAREATEGNPRFDVRMAPEALALIRPSVSAR